MLSENILCKFCDKVKNISEFNPSSLSAKKPKCKECRALYRQKNKESIKLYNELYRSQHSEEIAIQRAIYRENNREKLNNSSKDYYSKNRYDRLKYSIEHNKLDGVKENRKLYNKQYKKENKLQIALNSKIYYQNNKDYLQEKSKQWHSLNKLEVNVKKQAYYKSRKLHDPIFKFRMLISSSVSTMIATSGSRKNKSFLLAIDFSIEELLCNIEKLFQHPDNLTPDGKVWMNWSNHGKYNKKNWDDNNPLTWKWQLDHIIPHSTFKYSSMEDEEFKKCWSLENLRPYSAKQNVIDGVSKNRHGIK